MDHRTHTGYCLHCGNLRDLTDGVCDQCAFDADVRAGRRKPWEAEARELAMLYSPDQPDA